MRAVSTLSTTIRRQRLSTSSPISRRITEFEPALYFSTVSFTTLGYGDIVLGPDWRIMSAIEGANGLILFGWSTAFLISMMSKMRTLEHDWLER